MPVATHQAVHPHQDGFHADGGGLLFKKVTPRLRQDQFGRTSTRHGDYLLSMAVFPTGVRTPLLSEIQEKSSHQCGFEVTDKGTEKHVFILDSARHSHHSNINSRQNSASEGAKKPPPNTPMTVSKVSSDRGTRISVSTSPSSRKGSALQGYRWVKSTEPGSRTALLTGSQDGRQLIDIRDPLYLNTYCPDERKLRYKKTSTSLPRIFSRNRPWTVSEANPAYRFVRDSRELSNMQERRHGKSALPRHANFRIDVRDVTSHIKGQGPAHASREAQEEEEDDTESVQSGSQALLEVRSYFPHEEGEQPVEDQREALRGKEGCLHSRVKQCIKFVKHRDRMAKRVDRPMKQEPGKYRPFSTTRIRTPNVTPEDSPRAIRPDPKSVDTYKEYMDTIAMQTRLVSAVNKRRKTRHPISGLPRYNTAASSYKEDGSDTRTVQSVADWNRPPGNSATNSATTTTAKLSEGQGSHPASAVAAGGTGSVDPHGVHQALDIIRLSPKALPPRPAKSRGNRSHGEEAGDEEEGEGEEVAEEGGKEGEGAESDGGRGTKTHDIFLPSATPKSATASVCSFSRDLDDPGNATET